MAAPVGPPDLAHCKAPKPLLTGNCSPPYTDKIKEFEFPSLSSPMRQRPVAHLVSTGYVNKYAKAVSLMKQLDPSDPRNFMQQANVHCSYCDNFYTQPGMTIPSMYVTQMELHSIVDFEYNDKVDRDVPNHQIIDDNIKIMHRQIVGATTAPLFFGGVYCAGDIHSLGAGSLELCPHNTVHNWTGDRNQPYGEDMGIFYSAARDPIFYTHHSNIDRLWTIWKTLPGKNLVDFNHSDRLNASFLFYDENAELVKIKIADVLDPTKLR
ncbi:polyphenol oxidase, chloroplastic-like [Tasmannia lanceolata]|uniref:polyphenol oxidase, chloroplastic-like n=1 Tax=Tasmannia lanceolata TaxID=3420 RepID=UPI0040640F03